jgi:hypothetical protein
MGLFSKVFGSNEEVVDFNKIYLNAMQLLTRDQIIEVCYGYDSENGTQILNLLLDHLLNERGVNVCGYGLYDGIYTLSFIQELKNELSNVGDGHFDTPLWINIFRNSYASTAALEKKNDSAKFDFLDELTCLRMAFWYNNKIDLIKLQMLKENILSSESETSILRFVKHESIYRLLSTLGEVREVYESLEYRELIMAVLKVIPSLELSRYLRLDRTYLEVLLQMRDVNIGETGNTLREIDRYYDEIQTSLDAMDYSTPHLSEDTDSEVTTISHFKL